jgi:hypothetical protein
MTSHVLKLIGIDVKEKFGVSAARQPVPAPQQSLSAIEKTKRDLQILSDRLLEEMDINGTHKAYPRVTLEYGDRIYAWMDPPKETGYQSVRIRVDENGTAEWCQVDLFSEDATTVHTDFSKNPLAARMLKIVGPNVQAIFDEESPLEKARIGTNWTAQVPK